MFSSILGIYSSSHSLSYVTVGIRGVPSVAGLHNFPIACPGGFLVGAMLALFGGNVVGRRAGLYFNSKFALTMY